jgi:hypothetical protein
MPKVPLKYPDLPYPFFMWILMTLSCVEVRRPWRAWLLTTYFHPVLKVEKIGANPWTRRPRFVVGCGANPLSLTHHQIVTVLWDVCVLIWWCLQFPSIYLSKCHHCILNRVSNLSYVISFHFEENSFITVSFSV